MPELPVELLILPALSLAAGIDLYLTLLFIGAAPTIAWGSQPLPGALGDLDSPAVLLMVGALYILEFAAERSEPSALIWNAFHAVIRPVAGALLALLLLDGAPLLVVVGGALIGATLASISHAVRSGGAIIRWLGSASHPSVLLVSLLEDGLVLGSIALSLDAPVWALPASAGLSLGAAIVLPSYTRAFVFAIRLATARAFQTLTQRRWMSSEELPPWVRYALEGDILAPGGGLRGSPAAAHRLPGAPSFSTGWVVVRGSSPLFVYRRRRGAGTVDLGSLPAAQVVETDFFSRVDFGTGSGAFAAVFFGVNGPSEAGLRAEFLVA